MINPKSGHSGHCDIFFSVIQGYKTQFGPRFDTLPFITPQGGIVPGATLREHKDGCSAWETLQWDFVCQCTHDHDEMFVVKDEAGDPVANQRYRITDDDGNAHEGVTNDRGETKRIATRDRRQTLTLELVA